LLVQKFFILAQGSAEIILWLLIATSVVSVGMIFERFFTLRSIHKDNNKFREHAEDLLKTQNLDDIERLSQGGDSLSSRALSYGLRHIKNHGADGVEEVFNSFQLIEKPRLEKNLTFLATVGSNAPFVGLLGTVLGIMKAFKDLSISAGSGNQAVMEGIAHALVATAIGLFVAIPAVVAYNYFQRLVKQSLQSIDVAREICTAYSKDKKRMFNGRKL